MPIDCNNIPCDVVNPASQVVSVFGEMPTTNNSDCSTTILYLTDDKGLIDQEDSASGDYLTTTNRIKQVASIEELKKHYAACTRTGYELSKFLSYRAGELVRPANIVIGFWDAENESIIEAMDEITGCFTCFYSVTHVAYKSDGTTAIYDTIDQIELGVWATQHKTLAILPTIDIETLKDVTETDSNASKSKLNGSTYAVYQLLNEECENELDEDCLPTENIINIWGAQHLIMAGVATSVSSKSSSYEFNVKMKPLNGADTGMSVSSIDTENVRYVNGVIPEAGGVQQGWTHHVNVYQNIAGYKVLTEGISATGHFIDDLIHRRYIEDKLNESLIEMLVSNKNVPMSDSSKIRTSLIVIVRDFVRKGIITDIPKAIDLTEFENVFADGNGWVLTKNDLSQDNLETRITPVFNLCYVRQGSTNFISIGLCEADIGVK